jgi:hypothetical protein
MRKRENIRGKSAKTKIGVSGKTYKISGTPTRPSNASFSLISQGSKTIDNKLPCVAMPLYQATYLLLFLSKVKEGRGSLILWQWVIKGGVRDDARLVAN